MSVVPLNSMRTRPRPLNHRSSSAPRSNVPAVSIENAWILLYGRDVKSRFLPVTHPGEAEDDLIPVDHERGDLGAQLGGVGGGELGDGTVLEIDHPRT